VKKGVNTRFAIVDAGMNDLIRPALYQSYHKIENLTSSEKPEKYDVVGPICESSDCFGKAISLPKTSRNDLLAIRSTGAYGQTMSSQYNLRDLAATVYSDSE
jgi:diaminopimelate decarboxylase